MTALDLIGFGKDKVRRDSNLMFLYLDHFKKAFGHTPSCAGCSFNTDWQSFVKFHTKEELIIKTKTMSIQKIKLKKVQGKILSYVKNKKTYRLYDNVLTDDFISEYLKNGTKEQIEERKGFFVFPKEKKVKTSKKPSQVKNK